MNTISFMDQLSLTELGELVQKIAPRWRAIARCELVRQESFTITEAMFGDFLNQIRPKYVGNHLTDDDWACGLIDNMVKNRVSICKFKQMLEACGDSATGALPCLNNTLKSHNRLHEWIENDMKRPMEILRMLVNQNDFAAFGCEIGVSLDVSAEFNESSDLNRYFGKWIQMDPTVGELAQIMRNVVKKPAPFNKAFPELGDVVACKVVTKLGKAPTATMSTPVSFGSASSATVVAKPVSLFAAHLNSKKALNKNSTVQDFFESSEEPHAAYSNLFCVHITEEKLFRQLLESLGFPVVEEEVYRDAVPDENDKQACKKLIAKLMEVEGFGATLMAEFRKSIAKLQDEELNNILESWQKKLDKKLTALRSADAWTTENAQEMRKFITSALKAKNIGDANVNKILDVLKSKGINNLVEFRDLVSRLTPMQGAEYGLNYGETLAVCDHAKATAK